MSDYETIGLYEHNIAGYEAVKKALTIDDVVAILHATGTGKTFIALQLAYDNPDKKIVYVTPYNVIIEHVKQVIEENPNLDLERDFPNLELRTYYSFVSLSEEEIKDIDCDLLILDEFHHIGAPVWGARIDTMKRSHPNMKIVGMSAYSTRERGTPYERDMVDPYGDELFSGRVVSRYDLCDAMIDGVLPKLNYKSAYIKKELLDLEGKLEQQVKKYPMTTERYNEYMKFLSDAKRRIQEAPSIPKILKRTLKPDGKYIYFCPPYSEEGVNDIETIKKQALEWFKQFVPEEDIVIYTSTSEMGEDGKKNRLAFYNDTTLNGENADNKFRIMFDINQYNEGVKAPNIGGVIMGRGTTSDIVFFEQLGRALSVRGNTKEQFDELKKCSLDTLVQMCKDKDIPIKEDSSKDELIEKLIAPVIIDLANNYAFVKDLEDNLGRRIEERRQNAFGNYEKREIGDALFDIEIENQDLFAMLSTVISRLTMLWENKYELAKAYYEHYGNLEIPVKFKTINGFVYDANGIDLGRWLVNQRRAYNGNSGGHIITEEQINLLNQIGMRWENIDKMQQWMKKYSFAKAYYEHYGKLDIPKDFKTINGYEYDENGFKLGMWIGNQRKAYNGNSSGHKITKVQIDLLNQIGMRWNNMELWMAKYNLAKAYYEHYGNSDIPVAFKTTNGFDYDENGIALGRWLIDQRRMYKGIRSSSKFTEEQINLLNQIGMRWENKERMWQWVKKYNLAKAYYEYYGNLDIPVKFKTANGYEYDKNGVALGNWISFQRKNFGNLTEEKINLLNKIGMRWDKIDKMPQWMGKYNLAKAYYEHYGNLEISARFKTINGYDYDENGVALGTWIGAQRQDFDKLTEEQINLLNKIGMRWEKIDRVQQWEEKYNLAKAYYEWHGNLDIPKEFKTINGYEFDKEGVALGEWFFRQKKSYRENNMLPERARLFANLFVDQFRDEETGKIAKL